MNFKNAKGVTMLILAVTIFVMLILFGITFTTGIELLRNSDKNRIKTMLYMVRSRAEILFDDFMFENDKGDTNIYDLKDVDTSILGGHESTDTELSDVGYNSDTKYIYRTWNEQTLLNQGIDTKNLSDGDIIVVQYNLENEEVDVASQKGFSDHGVGIHKLKEFLE